MTTLPLGEAAASRFNRRVMQDSIPDLVQLSREIGREDRRLAILAEGNASARLDGHQFGVKASGANLATLTEDDISVCDQRVILAALDEPSLSDERIASVLERARIDGRGKKPSVEAMMHAWLLNLEGVNFVGHCHPVSANQILCSAYAREFAEKRIFPDEVVCCGPASVLVPYVDPGAALAREIRLRTTAFMQERGHIPRIILLENHGVIALGKSPNAVLAGLLMAAKAAEIFVGAAALGGPVFMAPEQIQRISTRSDEAYRQRQLKM